MFFYLYIPKILCTFALSIVCAREAQNGKQKTLQMSINIDILEDDILKLDKEVLERLLWDHSRQTFYDEHGVEQHHHIYWATDNYQAEGEGFGFFDEITIPHITGQYSRLVRPRAAKSREEQDRRTKEKAEVFTPSWVCNAQNNLIDNEWFGEENIFNTENEDHTWTPRQGNIPFPTKDGKTWIDYVSDTRLEITCGEAPYLVSRYDTTTGQPIEDLNMRIGLLDRKLRVVSENVNSTADWINYAKLALKSTYGFEWQGDNLLLAREAILFTFIDFYEAFCHKIGVKPVFKSYKTLQTAAYIISWNIFQMDGIRFMLPMSGSKENAFTNNAFSLFEGQIGSDNRHPIEKKPIPAKVAEWFFEEEKKKKSIVEFRHLIH